MIYFVSYVYQDPQGVNTFDTFLTRKHPILHNADWVARDNHQSVVSYQKVTDEQLGDLELQKYIDDCINTNYGELIAKESED